MNITSVKNIVTDAAIFKTTPAAKIEVVEIERRFVVFQIPESKDGWHSMYMVSGVIPLEGKNIPYEFTGKMTCLETAGGFSRIRFDLLQYDRALWLKFLEQLQEKQTRADKIFTSIKGEG